MPSMHDKVLRKEDRNLLGSLPKEISGQFYLAGGTGLALQIGHRYSNDLDFFSKDHFNNLQIKQQLESIGTIEIMQDQPGTLEGTVQDTRFTFLYYTYPLLDSTVNYANIEIASLLDIALMKLSALSSRGSRKDFVDLYFLRDRLDWQNLIERFEQKYEDSGYNLFHVIKSLAYFDDAVQEPDLRMIKHCDWEDVEAYFRDVQVKLANSYLN